MDNSMDNAEQTEANQEHKDRQIPVTEVGWVCVYCGAETQDLCCGEVHHELAYETGSGDLVLESELTELHVIIEE